MANTNLTKAKKAKNDEFYTQFNDIQKEVNAYLDYDENVFRDKTILLPCDDPEWSNFTKFFAQNFERFGLKKLISTSYAKNSKYQHYGQLDLFEDADFIKKSEKYDPENNDFKGKIFTLERGDKKVDIDNLQWDYLNGDGDFRSDEVKKIRNKADIVITNPPFSLFHEFISWLMEVKIHFLIIGSMNAIANKKFFPYFQKNKIWLGNGFANGNAFFSIPKNASLEYADGVYNSETNLVKFRNCCWFTNLDHGKRHEPLKLMTMANNVKFNKKLKNQNYTKYDNFDAIEVPYTDAIPSDYEGYMGVPISFLTKHCPEQFEIIGSSASLAKPVIINNKKGSGRFYINNKRLYERVVIKRVKE